MPYFYSIVLHDRQKHKDNATLQAACFFTFSTNTGYFEKVRLCGSHLKKIKQQKLYKEGRQKSKLNLTRYCCKKKEMDLIRQKNWGRDGRGDKLVKLKIIKKIRKSNI